MTVKHTVHVFDAKTTWPLSMPKAWYGSKQHALV